MSGKPQWLTGQRRLPLTMSRHSLCSWPLDCGLASTRRSLVTALGVNPNNSSELFALDLQQDPAALVSMSDQQLAEHIIDQPRPISSVRLNACPVFMPIEIAGPLAAGYDLGMDELSRRATFVRNDDALRHRLIAAVVAGRVPFAESPHVEEQIYGGFYCRSDEALIDEFHNASWPRRLELAGSFADARLRTLARRLVYCEAPDVLPAELRAVYARAIAARVHSRTETTGRWTTLDEALDEALSLREGAEDARRALVQGHLDRLIA